MVSYGGSTRRTRTAWRLAALAAVSALGLTACGGNSLDSKGGGSKATDDPFVVYLAGDFSGAAADYTKAIKAGMQIAADKLNAKDGITGRKVEIKSANDQNDPTAAVSNYQKYKAANGTPDLVYPGSSSAVSLSLLPLLTKDKVLSVGATTSAALNDPAKFPYHFGVAEASATYVPSFVKIAEEKKYAKVGIIYSNDATGQAAKDMYSQELKTAGVEVVEAGYETKALDMTAQLNQLKAAHVDALVYDGYGTAVLYLLKSRLKTGWDVPAYADQLSGAFPAAAYFSNEELKNVYNVQPSWLLKDQEPKPEGLDEFSAEAAKTSDGKLLAQVGVTLFAMGHDALMVAAYGIDGAAGKDAKSTPTAAKVSAYLEHMEAPGTAGTPWLVDGIDGTSKIAYTAENHFPTPPGDWFHYVAPGSFDDAGFYVPGLSKKQ